MSEALTREIEELRLLMGSPRDPHGRVFAQLGDALRRAGSHREALTVLLDGVTEHPNFSPGHLVLGWTAQESGDFTVARTAFERTLELDPENPNGLFGLGTLLDREGDPRGADLIDEAESLDSRVRVTAPTMPEGGQDEGPAAEGGEPGLEHLPFLSLEEIAPDMTLEEGDPPAPVATDEALFGLPFIPLEELSPEGEDDGDAELERVEAELAEAVADGAEAIEDGAEVVDEVTADAVTEGGDEEPATTFDALPFISLEELRPAPEAGPDPEPPTPVHEDHEEEEDLDLAGPLATRTMGELLVRQGLTAQAVEVFETLVERSPDDAGLRDRLDELRGELEGVREAATEGEGGLDTPAEDLLESAAHPSMDPPVPHPEVPSPFHLGAGEGDDVSEDDGEGVGDYFARLLGWSPRQADDPGEAGGPSAGEGSDSS